MEAAIAAFFERGYAATSIEQIAAEAGVSKVTVYSHFGDKRALFTAAVETECERLLLLVDRLGAGGPDALTKEPHPFFGRLSVEEWDALQWKHLGHHLRQFGG